MSHRDRDASACRLRTALRAGSLAAGAGLVAGVVGLAGTTATVAPALAEEPMGWEPSSVSGWQFLLVIVVFPAVLFLIVAGLAALPSMIRARHYEPGQAWHAEDEWFGGPRRGLGAGSSVDPPAGELESASDDRGGAGARW